MADEITAGGNGADGRLSLLGADGKPIVGMQIVTRRAPSLKDTRIDVGAPDRPGMVALFNSEGDQTALLTPQSLAIGGRGRSGEKRGTSGQITLNGSDGTNAILLSVDRDEAKIWCGEGGHPGSVELLDGTNVAGRNTVELTAKDATVRAGGGGKTGTVSLWGGDGKPRIGMSAADASIRLGGNGSTGTVSVLGTDGQPLVELLGRGNEAVIGLGQANRPGRISMYNGQRGEALRLDANSGDILLLNADCAEEFDISEPGVAPGTVMVLTDDGSLAPSEKPADTRVAGVVSGAGSFRPGLILDRRDTGAERAPIALMGKVYCFVDATEEPVRVGDLLTTAEHPGHAMRIVDPQRAVGAILGKALAPLPTGRGLIPILVTLQ